MANKGQQEYDEDIIAAMNGNKPFSQYIKTILGKVGLSILDPFSAEPKGILLSGDPVATNPEAIVSLWSLTEDIYFKRHNKMHFDTGTIVPYKADAVKLEETRLEQSTDEEIAELVHKPFLAIINALNKTNSEAFVYRVLRIAQDEERSEKIISAINKRLAEIQNVYVSEPTEE